MYARYKSHDDATLSYMVELSHCFDTFNDVFLLRRAGNWMKAKATVPRMEIVNKRMVGEETHADAWAPSKKQREMNTWWDHNRHKIDISQELDSDFNFMKIHFMSHWAENIHHYGFLQQYPA
jgi:hypothetical protein